MTRQYAAVISLGCAKNLVDSETMIPRLMRLGYSMTSEPSEADLIVVNTCGFLQSAVEEAIETILELAGNKVSGRCRHLVVTGCMVQRYGRKLPPLLPEVDLFLGTSHYHRIDEALPALNSPDSTNLYLSRPTHIAGSSEPRVRATPFFSAYVKIAEGCCNSCSFCLIPRLRGAYRSRTVEDVLAEVRMLSEEGVKEINLIAQDVTAFGTDRGDTGSLVRLLELIEDVHGIQWVRLLYAYPDRIEDTLLRTMAHSSKIVPYLDIPVQHSVPEMLQAMGRRAGAFEVEERIEGIRSFIPGIALRTSLMVGFPGETESDFRQLVDFAARVRFDHAGVFVFSPEAGTRAARLPSRVPAETAEERRHILMDLQRSISRRRLREKVGSVIPVLIEGTHPETELLLEGRSAFQAPEVDGTVIITGGTGNVGEIVPARITSSHDYDLEAELISPGVDASRIDEDPHADGRSSKTF